MDDQVNVLLVGDSKCGKSSIIYSINNSEFVDNLPNTVDNVVIPAGYARNHSNLVFVDSSSAAENDMECTTRMKAANVIIVVIDVTNEQSCNSVFAKWMPIIQRVAPITPIIIAANKIDCLNDDVEDEEQKKIDLLFSRILNEWEMVETCVKCSAKSMLHLTDVIYFSDRSYNFPSSPLYNRQKQCLRDNVKCIIRRIFRIFNRSHTLSLNDDELAEFQRFCYGTTITVESIRKIKSVISKHGSEDYIDPYTNGITEDGFIYLMQMYAMKDNIETIWLALRKFNYTNDLQLILDMPSFKLDADQTVEFTAEGRLYLSNLFKTYDSRKEGVLHDDDIKRLFAPVEDNEPLWTTLSKQHHIFMNPTCPKNCLSNEYNELTYSGWIGEWILMLNIAPELTLKTILTLGYADDISYIYVITQRKQHDWDCFDILHRNVIHVFAFGDKGTGKSVLLSHLIRSTLPVTYVPTLAVQTTVAPVIPKTERSEEKTMIFSEIPPCCEETVLANHMNACDMACLVFDATKIESLHYVINLHKRMSQKIKVMFVATHGDLIEHISFANSEICQECNEYVVKKGLEQPLVVSKNGVERLFSILFECATCSELCIPECEEEENNSHIGLKLTALTIVIALVVGGIYIMKRRH